MYDEDNFVPISALQHLLYCSRQCGLIHLEGLWRENRLTAEGGRMHRRAHQRDRIEIRGDVRIVRRRRLHSRWLGLAGIADVVEFHPAKRDSAEPGVRGVTLPGTPGLWRPFLEPDQWVRLRGALLDEFEPKSDSLHFYFLGSNWRRRIERHGAKETYDPEGPLIA